MIHRPGHLACTHEAYGFAPNVCKKALIVADPENRCFLIDKRITPKQDNNNPIAVLMKDQLCSAFWI